MTLYILATFSLIYVYNKFLQKAFLRLPIKCICPARSITSNHGSWITRGAQTLCESFFLSFIVN